MASDTYLQILFMEMPLYVYANTNFFNIVASISRPKFGNTALT